MASPDVETSDKFFVHKGPEPGVTYPQEILYCDECDGWPLEYTEHHPNYEGAKKWMEKNLNDEMRALYLGEIPVGERSKASEGGGEEGGASEEGKKRQKRGGKGVIKPKKKTQEPQGVQLSRASRGKRKYVTVVTGLASYGIDLKVASKYFGSRFACGSSVTGEDEIVIQGDVKDDLFDIIPEKWDMIDEDSIDDLGDQKRS